MVVTRTESVSVREHVWMNPAPAARGARTRHRAGVPAMRRSVSVSVDCRGYRPASPRNDLRIASITKLTLPDSTVHRGNAIKKAAQARLCTAVRRRRQTRGWPNSSAAGSAGRDYLAVLSPDRPTATVPFGTGTLRGFGAHGIQSPIPLLRIPPRSAHAQSSSLAIALRNGSALFVLSVLSMTNCRKADSRACCF